METTDQVRNPFIRLTDKKTVMVAITGGTPAKPAISSTKPAYLLIVPMEEIRPGIEVQGMQYPAVISVTGGKSEIMDLCKLQIARLIVIGLTAAAAKRLIVSVEQTILTRRAT